MSNRITAAILAGNVPYLGVVVLCVGCAYAGYAFKAPPPPPKVAVADRAGLIMQAMFEGQRGIEAEEAAKHVQARVVGVLRRYSDAGYVVFDGARDENGLFGVAALPQGAVDITEEMRAEVFSGPLATNKTVAHAGSAAQSSTPNAGSSK